MVATIGTPGPSRLSDALLEALAADVRVRDYAAAPSEVLALIAEVRESRPQLEALQGQVLQLGRRIEKIAGYANWCMAHPPAGAS